MESGVRGQESGVSSQYAGVRGQKLEFRVGGLGVGGGAKVRASGCGVSAEVPRGEAFGHRRRYPRLTAGGGAKVRARGYGVFAEVSPILLTHYINFSDLLKHSAFSASLR